MSERFTESTRHVLFCSRHNALLDGSASIEGRHLLYALLSDQDPIVLASLRRFQVSADRLLGVLPPVPQATTRNRNDEIPFTEETKRVLAFAAEEADGLKHAKIWTGHVLLGLLREELSTGGGLLTRSGVSVEGVRIVVGESV